MSDKKLIKLDQLNSNPTSLDGIDLSGGFVCDFETGICGTATEITNTKTVEEKENANHNMV